MSIINDWLWIDYHDRINVFGGRRNETRTSGTSLSRLFNSPSTPWKDAASLAVIGGIIEPGEEPEVAARREVAEEMGGVRLPGVSLSRKI